MASVSDISNPWKGLSSYTEGEIIYGRDKDIENLFTLITTNQEITILYGQSGIGKTSLLRAGLFPWLRSSHIFPVYVRLGHDETDKSYVEQVIETVENEAQKYNIKQTDLTLDKPAPNSLWEFLHRYDFHTESGEKCVPMIFFDQFEELFTISANRIKNVEEFIRDLGDVLNGTTPEYLLEVASKESEPSLGKKENFSDKGSELDLDFNLEIDNEDQSSLKSKKDFLLAISIREDYIYHLDRISAAIPALKRNRYFLHGLDEIGAREVIKCPVKNLVDNTVTNEIIGVCHNADEKYITPAFISLLMYNLFERMQQKGQTTITSSLVNGSIGDIFYNYYVNSIKGLSDESIDFLEDRLISKGGFRLTVPVSDALAAGVTEGEIKQLEDKRLIVRSKRGNNDFIELTHDLLCKEIQKDKEERDKVKKSKKSRRRILILSCLVVLFFAISSLFIWQLIELNHRENAWLINQSRAVAGIANLLTQDGDSYTATMLALEVLPKNIKDPNRPLTLEAEMALRKSLLNNLAVIQTPGQVSSLDVSPEGSIIVAGMQDGSLTLWDAENGKLIWKSTKGLDKPTTIVAFSPNGKRLASASAWENKICVWDAETGQQIVQFDGHSDGIRSLAFSSDDKKIASGSKDNTICIWDIETGQQLGSPFTAHTDIVTALAFSPNGKMIASGSLDKTIRIWDIENFNSIGGPIGDLNEYIEALLFNEDGKKLTAVSTNKLAICGISEFEKSEINTNVNHDWLSITVLHPELEKATIKFSVKDNISGKTQNIYSNTKNKEVNLVSFSPDGKRVIIKFSDNTIGIYNTETGEQIGETIEKTHPKICQSISLSAEGNKIISSIHDSSIFIWDYNPKPFYLDKLSLAIEGDDFENVNDLLAHKKCLLSPNGNILAVSILDAIFLFDITTGKQIGHLTDNDQSYLNLMSFSPDGKKIAATTWDRIIKIWDTETGKQICKPLKGHTKLIYSISFNEDSKKIISTSKDSTLRVWNTETGEQIGDPITNSNTYFSDITLSPDGLKIATNTSKGNIQIWDSDFKEQISSIDLPFQEILLEYLPIQFSPDGKKLLCDLNYGNLSLIDLETGNLSWLNSALSHYLFPDPRVFTPDSKYFVSYINYPEGSVIQLSDLETSKVALEIPVYGESEDAIYCGYSPNLNKIILVYQNGDLYSLDWKPLQQLIDEQRERFKDRKLTPEERRQYYLE